ncbi:hypothetical protein D3C71_1632290 [compost metagenome]
MDRLGVPLAHQKHDRRGVGRGVVGQAGLPVGFDQAARSDFVDIGGQSQSDHVAGQAVDDGAGLLAGPAVRLFDGEGRAALFTPVREEGFVIGAVELARRVIGDVEQGGLRPLALGATAESQRAERKSGCAHQKTAAVGVRAGHYASSRTFSVTHWGVGRPLLRRKSGLNRREA